MHSEALFQTSNFEIGTTMIAKLLLAILCLFPIQEKQSGDEKKQSVDKKPAAVKPDQFAKNWTGAFASNDPENLLKFYESGPKVVVRMASGVKVVGTEKLKELYKSEFEQTKFLYSKTKNVSVRQFDEMTILSFEHLFAFKTEEKNFQGHVQTVMILRKSKNSWKIVDEHSSPIKDIPRLQPIE